MRPALLVVPLAAVAAVACSNATDGVVGGEPLPVIASMAQCSETGPACSTWTYLYNCYFGPTGAAGCSAQANCHATAGGLGGSISGFVCGPTAETCWHGMTSTGAPIPVLKGVTTLSKTFLYTALHKSTGAVTMTENNMPLMTPTNPTQPAYTFTSADLACIGGWIAAGAPEN
ncbi:MAG: hypothetical protein ACLP1X_14040 [Polyangiaceae bacterium]